MSVFDRYDGPPMACPTCKTALEPFDRCFNGPAAWNVWRCPACMPVLPSAEYPEQWFGEGLWHDRLSTPLLPGSGLTGDPHGLALL